MQNTLKEEGWVQDTYGVGRLSARHMWGWKTGRKTHAEVESLIQNPLEVEVWVQDTCGVGRLSARHIWGWKAGCQTHVEVES